MIKSNFMHGRNSVKMIMQLLNLRRNKIGFQRMLIVKGFQLISFFAFKYLKTILALYIKKSSIQQSSLITLFFFFFVFILLLLHQIELMIF